MRNEVNGIRIEEGRGVRRLLSHQSTYTGRGKELEKPLWLVVTKRPDRFKIRDPPVFTSLFLTVHSRNPLSFVPQYNNFPKINIWWTTSEEVYPVGLRKTSLLQSGETYRGGT